MAKCRDCRFIDYFPSGNHLILLVPSLENKLLYILQQHPLIRGIELVYTGQSPPLTKEEIEPLLKEARIARFCSHNKDGTIHAVPMNYKYENKQIIIPTPAASSKVRNIKRNPNVTVLIDVEKQPVKGVIIYGKAQLEYDDILTSSISVYEKTMPKRPS